MVDLKKIIGIIPYAVGYFFTVSFMQILVYYSLTPAIPKLVSDIYLSWLPLPVATIAVLISLLVGGLIMVYGLPLLIWDKIYEFKHKGLK